MAEASASIDIPAAPSDVWQLVGGFNSLPDWLGNIPKSELSEGGRVRHLGNPNGETIVERLEKFDNAGRSYRYSILKAPFPITGICQRCRSRPRRTEKGRAWTSRPPLLPMALATKKPQKYFRASSEVVVVEEFFKTVRPTSLIKRFISPQEVAGLVAYLCSPLAAATTGAAVRIDGGVVPAIL